MSTIAPTTVKRITRARKSIAISDQTTGDTSLSSKALKPLEDAFSKLIHTITTAKNEYENLQKQIEEIKEIWNKEQRLHVVSIQERDREEDLVKRREKETYEYETKLTRKKDEDEFLEKKVKWEKELISKKEELQKDKEELENLRKQVLGFDAQVARAVKEATDMLRQDITDTFMTEKKMREQEIKAEKELLAFKITNLAQENGRLTGEVSLLKKSLEEATSQLKEVAVKVIESSSPQVKPQTPSAL